MLTSYLYNFRFYIRYTNNYSSDTLRGPLNKVYRNENFPEYIHISNHLGVPKSFKSFSFNVVFQWLKNVIYIYI